MYSTRNCTFLSVFKIPGGQSDFCTQIFRKNSRIILIKTHIPKLSILKSQPQTHKNDKWPFKKFKNEIFLIRDLEPVRDGGGSYSNCVGCFSTNQF